MQADLDNVKNCAGTLYDYTDKKGRLRNALLDAELRQQQDDDIFTIPTIIINNEPYRGGYTCPHPPQLATCGVLSAVCSAFIDGKEPPACGNDYCWDQFDDCGTVRGRFVQQCLIGTCYGMRLFTFIFQLNSASPPKTSRPKRIVRVAKRLLARNTIPVENV